MNVNNILNKYTQLICGENDNDLTQTTCESESSNKNICLISKEPLGDFEKITLPCGHSFNYKYLYDEIYHQKYKNINLVLRSNEFICPYCRKHYDKLIPYYEIENVDMNNSAMTSKTILPLITCNWKYKSGKNKGHQCSSPACKFKLGSYCQTHIKKVKIAHDKKQVQSQLHSAEEKIKGYCSAILQSGKRKGEFCMAKCCNKGVYCARHRKKYELPTDSSLNVFTNQNGQLSISV